MISMNPDILKKDRIKYQDELNNVRKELEKGIYANIKHVTSSNIQLNIMKNDLNYVGNILIQSRQNN